jgi:hypothetical protein
MKVFDAIIDQSGFGSEVTDETVLEATKPLLKAWDEASGNPAGPEVHSEVITRILAELKNERERQQPFEVPYQAFDDSGTPQQHVLRFKLLMEQFGYGGGIVLEVAEMLDAVAGFQEDDHAMTDSEAKALRNAASRNAPKIPVRSLPRRGR